MKKIIIAVIVIALALAGIVSVLKKNKAENEAQIAIVAIKNTSVAVRTDSAKMQLLSLEYTANGILAAKQEVSISASSVGKIVSVLVKEGDYVKPGQTLAIIESDKQNVNVSNAQAMYNNAQEEVARFEKAYSTGGVTKQQLDQIKLQLENAKNNLKSAKLAASDVNITASFAGIVNTRKIEPGSYVNYGQEMFEIVNVATLKLKVNVDEKTIGSVRLGQNVEVSIPVLPNKTWNGVVSFIAPKADASLNFPVELEIKNNTGSELKAGMYGTAKFGKEKNVEVLVVPRTAFVGNVSSNRIFVVKNGKAHLTEVVSGRNFGEQVEILSGIQANDVVVVSGQINLQNETVVEIIK